MSVFNFPGYLAHSRKSLGGELIGFNKKTGQAVYAAAGVQGIGSYADLSTDFYKTYRPDNWQHAGSRGWSSANMPGWGNNPNLQMFARRGVGALGCPPCNVNFGPGGCVPCPPGADLAECIGCDEEPVKEGFFSRNAIWPAVISGVIIAVATGITINVLAKRGVSAS